MSARDFWGDWDLVAHIVDAGGTIKPPVLPTEPQVFTFGGGQPGQPSPVDAVLGPICSLATIAPADGTLTISTPPVDGATLWHLADPRPITTFAPAPRAALEALRAAIDRALAVPRVVQRCEGVFGGSPVLLAVSWTGEP